MNFSCFYLVCVFYEWIVDNDCMLYILVNVEFVGVKVFLGYVSDGQIVFNVLFFVVWYLYMDNEVVSFEGCFGGVVQSLYILVLVVMVIYVWENGQGMVFDLEQLGLVDDELGDDDGGLFDELLCFSGRLFLKVVK